MEDPDSCRNEPQFRVFPLLHDCILFTGNSKPALKSAVGNGLLDEL